MTGSLADALAPPTPGPADGDPAETPADDRVLGHGSPGEASERGSRPLPPRPPRDRVLRTRFARGGVRSAGAAHPRDPLETVSRDTVRRRPLPPGRKTTATPPRPPADVPRGIPVPGPTADAPPLPGTPAAPALRPPPAARRRGRRRGRRHAHRRAPVAGRPVPAAVPLVDRGDRRPGRLAGHHPGRPRRGRTRRRPDAGRHARGPGAGGRPRWCAASSVPPRGVPRPRRRRPPPSAPSSCRGRCPRASAGGGVARPEETVPPWASGAARSEGLPGRELFARGPGPRAGAILGAARRGPAGPRRAGGVDRAGLRGDH